jgi:hypothetical protein
MLCIIRLLFGYYSTVSSIPSAKLPSISPLKPGWVCDKKPSDYKSETGFVNTNEYDS